MEYYFGQLMNGKAVVLILSDGLSRGEVAALPYVGRLLAACNPESRERLLPLRVA